MNTVNDAAKYLDSFYPGWFNEIDVEKLNQDDSLYCVLGQLYGSYFSEESIKVIRGLGSQWPFAGGELDQTIEWENEIMSRLSNDDDSSMLITALESGLSNEVMMNIVYCVDQSDLDIVDKDAIYRELYRL